MISLDKEQIYLLELVKASLFGLTPEIPEDANWEKIFEAAKAQCIVPLLASCVPSEYKDKWNTITYQNKAHYMQMIYEQNALVKLLNDNGIPFAILKGTAAAIYYPNPLLRSFGDIDFYVTDNYFESVQILLENNGYHIIHNNERHYGYEKNGIEIELHNRFSCQHYNDIDHIVKNGLNHAVNYTICGNCFPGISTYENGIVLLGHIMQHLKEDGIGIRQFIDWMMFVHKELDDFAWDTHFNTLAKEAGLEKLALTATYICKEWLGLPNEITWCDNANEKLSEQLLIQILDDGNFGYKRAPFEIVKKSMKKEGVFKFLQKEGLSKWSLAQKYSFFRPFAWSYQLFRILFNGISGLFIGKKVFRSGKHKMSLKRLLKSL